MDNLRWLRVVGDLFIAVGILALGWFVLGLVTGWSVDKNVDASTERDSGSASRDAG